MCHAALTACAALVPKRPPCAAVVTISAAFLAGMSGMTHAQSQQQTAPTRSAHPAEPAALSPQLAQLLASARKWEGMNRPDMARHVIKKALLISPQQPEALAMMGEIELKSNRIKDAAKYLQQLRQIAPNHPATQELADAYRLVTTGKGEIAQIEKLAAAGQHAQASQRLQALFPNGAPHGDLAHFYYRILAGTPEGRAQALADLQTRIRENPDDLNLQLVLADVLTNDWSTRLQGLNLLYRVYQQPQSNRKMALDLWRRALVYSPHDDPAYYIWWRRYLQEVPGDPLAQSVVAEFERKGVNEATAARLAERGNAGAPRAPETPEQRARREQGDALGEQGLARQREGRQDEARALFERALTLDPDNARKWRSLIATATLWGTIAKANTANSQGKPAEGEALAREALRQDPSNVIAQRALIDALIAQQKWPEAEAVARPLATAAKPDIDALRDLVTILRATHRENEIDPLMASVSPRLASSGSQAQLARMRATVLSLQAQQSMTEKNNSAAIAKLEEAVRLTPDDPWLRYSLAQLYAGLKLPALGRAVMEDCLKAAPSTQMRYASALYFNYALGDIDAANAQIEQISPQERTQPMRELADNITAQRLVRDARQQTAEGRDDEARASLRQAEAVAQNDPQMLATIGQEWIALGDADRGLALVKDWLDAHPQDPAIAVRLRYGDLLAAAHRDDDLAVWTARSRALPGMTDTQRAQFDDQSLRLALRTVNRQLDSGDVHGARRTLAGVPDAQHTDARWLLAQADVDETAGDFRAGARAAQSALAKQPDNADARLTLARMYEHMGRRTEATALTREVLADTPADDVNTRLAIAQRLVAQGHEDEAAAVIGPLRGEFPQRSDLTLQAGRIDEAQGRFNDAAALYREAGTQERAEGPPQPGTDGLTPVGRALQQLQDRRQPDISTEVIQSNLNGDPGTSRLNATTVPLYVRIPDGYTGHYFFHADTVYLDAGSLPGGDFNAASQYGKIAAFGNAGLGSIHQSATGVSLAAGYEFKGAKDSWRVDIGSTPLGFPIESVLGGLQYQHQFPDATLGVDLSRRPVTDSLVSYAGGVDPVTGEKWGGVVRNTITLRGSQNIFASGNVYGSVSYGVLTGENVPSDNELRLLAGVSWPVFQTPNQRVTSGLFGLFWHYSRNEHFYTFGNGGYFSPQRFTSVGLPIDWTGRYERFSWEVRGSVGWSFTHEDTSPYFPTSSLLQDLAVARLSAANLGAPYFGAGSTNGFSYTVAAAAEYRITPHWIVGGSIEIDRSHDYAPNVGMVWLRYLFTPQHGPVPFPPRPVTPYSAY
ncbi:cellulose synthase operon C domain protein [Burkholderia sp. H160]|nr:cellulose synthase operon C domain protein [Burkholderia sp. H160]